MKRLGLAALLVGAAAVAAAKKQEVVFLLRVDAPNRAPPFTLQLVTADGGVVWQRGRSEMKLDDRGRGTVRASGWKSKHTPSKARFELLDAGLEHSSCERALTSIPDDEPRVVFAVFSPEAGCTLAERMTRTEYLLMYPQGPEDLDLQPAPVGDFPPYEPPHVHGKQ